MVKTEIVDAGKKKGCVDAFAVERNIEIEMITVIASSGKYLKGDQALISLYDKHSYDAVATDDIKLTRALKANSIPFLLPGTIFYVLFKKGIFNLKSTRIALKKLSEFISDDEFNTVMLLLEAKK